MASVGVTKSDVDYKNYRFIELPNGLRVMLISSLKPEKTVDNIKSSEIKANKNGLRKSAAALCVHVGSFSDPKDAEGLAHFLEHMVFMGSEKYPRENDFDDYVSHHDGKLNANTWGDYTVFFFDIQRSSFKEALDKFANFFIAPLLKKDCVDRELEAVHSEFEECKARDFWRISQVISSFAKDDSPMRSFVIGNRLSLRDMPEKSGTNVYKMLREFQLRYYSAPLMTLAVESKDTLESLEAMVNEIFGAIPNRNSVAPDFSSHSNPFPSTAFKKAYKICPVKETAKISFIWSLPPMQSHYKSAALKILGSIIGDEGRGSLMAFLRKKNLAVELNAGCPTAINIFHNEMISLFEIGVELSELGRTSTAVVADYVFSYLHMLRKTANLCLPDSTATIVPCGGRSFASLVPEYETLWQSNFRFQEALEPLKNVTTVAVKMRQFPLRDIFVAESLILQRDLKGYIDLANNLTPDKVMIVTTLPEFNAEALRDTEEKVYKTEPWYGTRYAVEDLPDCQIEKWQNAPILEDFHLPEANRYIITNFDLLPKDKEREMPQEEHLGKLQQFGQLWYQPRVKFNVPSGSATVRIYSDLITVPIHFVILRLWSCALDQRLRINLYCATEAGLSFSVRALDRGMEIEVSGFSEKLFQLYREILDVMAAPLTGDEDEYLFNEEKFVTYKDRLRQQICNRLLNPHELNEHLWMYFRQVNIHLLEDCMKALESITLADVEEFVPRFFSRLYVKAYVYGNLCASEALQFFDYTIGTFKPKEVAVLSPYPKAVLPPCVSRLRVMNFNKTDVNTCLVLVAPLQGSPSDDLRLEVMNEFLQVCLQEPAFGYLRTKETLGYWVGLYSFSHLATSGECGLSVLVASQSNKFNSDLVAGRIYAFWYRIVPHIIFNLKQEVFKTLVDSMIARNSLEDALMQVEFSRNKKEVFSHHPVLDRRQRSVDILRQLKLSDVQDFCAKTYFAFDRQPILMIQVDSLSDKIPEDGSSQSENPMLQKTFDWPLHVVPLSENQAATEQSAALEVNVLEAVQACAADLVIPTAFSEEPEEWKGDRIKLKGSLKPGLPVIKEISNVRDFKHTILFPQSQHSN